jgi:hypothetical protein
MFRKSTREFAVHLRSRLPFPLVWAPQHTRERHDLVQGAKSIDCCLKDDQGGISYWYDIFSLLIEYVRICSPTHQA